MKLDFVHDLQAVYRALLTAMSRPGTIGDIAEQAGRIDMNLPCLPATMAIALTLLDAETGFAAVGGPEGFAALVSRLSYAPECGIDAARFILIHSTASAEQRASALENASRGNLIDPHLGATLILECQSLAFGSGDTLVLSGPGIQSTRTVQISGYEDWLAKRALVNAEFPLGIDVILIDPASRVLCLPRTCGIAVPASAGKGRV